MRAMLVAAGCLSLAACATPYQEATWWNNQGVTGKQITSDTLMISAQGNALTSRDTVQQYVLRKAAEMTLAAGNDWFAPVTSQDRTSTGAFATSFGSSAFAMPLMMPGSSMTVRMGKNPKPDAALDARDVVSHLAK